MFSAGPPIQSRRTKNLSKPEEGGLHSTQLKWVSRFFYGSSWSSASKRRKPSHLEPCGFQTRCSVDEWRCVTCSCQSSITLLCPCLIQEPHWHASSLSDTDPIGGSDNEAVAIPHDEPGLRVDSIIVAFLHSKWAMQWLPYIDWKKTVQLTIEVILWEILFQSVHSV